MWYKLLSFLIFTFLNAGTISVSGYLVSGPIRLGVNEGYVFALDTSGNRVLGYSITIGSKGAWTIDGITENERIILFAFHPLSMHRCWGIKSLFTEIKSKNIYLTLNCSIDSNNRQDMIFMRNWITRYSGDIQSKLERLAKSLYESTKNKNLKVYTQRKESTEGIIKGLCIHPDFIIKDDIKSVVFKDDSNDMIEIQWPIYLDEDATNQNKIIGNRHGTLYYPDKRKDIYKKALKAIISLPMDDPKSLIIMSSFLENFETIPDVKKYIKDVWDLSVETAGLVNKKYVRVNSISDKMKNDIKTLARKLRKINNKNYQNIKALSIAISDLEATITLFKPFVGALYWQAINSDLAVNYLEKLRELGFKDPALNEAINEVEEELSLNESYWRSLVLELYENRQEFLEGAVTLGITLTSIGGIQLIPIMMVWQTIKWIAQQEDYARTAVLAGELAVLANREYLKQRDDKYLFLEIRGQQIFYDVSYKVYSTGLAYIFSKFNIRRYGDWNDYLFWKKNLADEIYAKLVERQILLKNNLTKSLEIFCENFERGLNGWKISNGVWQVGNPLFGPPLMDDEKKCAGTVLNFNYPNLADSRLISPNITLPSLNHLDSHLILSFWHWYRFKKGDYGYVEISKDDGNSWTRISEPISGDQSYWTKFSKEIDHYKGEKIKIAFHILSDKSVNDRGWYIDKVKIDIEESNPVRVKILNINTDLFPFVFLTIKADTWGFPIYTLTEKNFQICENNKFQRNYFKVTPPNISGKVRKIDIVFCMDNSGSMSDEIEGVSDHVLNFIRNLAKTGYDFSLGLVRFGGNENKGYPIVENNGYLTNDGKFFIDSLWHRNHANGGFEPGWDALVAATTQIKWRRGSSKILFLLTDETVHQSDNNQGKFSYDQTLRILKENNITVFTMIDPQEAPNCIKDYGSLADSTGGFWIDIQSPMDSILKILGSTIMATYIIRYKSTDTTSTGKRVVILGVRYKSDAAADEIYYKYGPRTKIILTEFTKNLINNISLARGQSVGISALVTGGRSSSDTMRLYFKRVAETNYHEKPMCNLRDSLYYTVLPASVIDTPGVQFYFEIKDSMKSYTLPVTNPEKFPFTLEVVYDKPLPNKPYLFLVPGVDTSADQGIKVLIYPGSKKIEGIWLYFREYGTIVWDSVQMNLVNEGPLFNTSSNLNFSSQEVVDSAITRNLPLRISSYVEVYDAIMSESLSGKIEYYILAIDQNGIHSNYGSPDNPHIKFIGKKMIINRRK